jgi:hypothetical protein
VGEDDRGATVQIEGEQAPERCAPIRICASGLRTSLSCEARKLRRNQSVSLGRDSRLGPYVLSRRRVVGGPAYSDVVAPTRLWRPPPTGEGSGGPG